MVVLPAPLGPTIAASCPGFTSKLTSSIAQSRRISLGTGSFSSGASPFGTAIATGGRWIGSGLGPVDNVVRHLQVVEDALEERQTCLDLDRDGEHAADGEEQPALQGGEGHDGSVLDRCVRTVAARDDESSNEIDECRRTAEERADNRKQRSPDHLLTNGEVGEPVVLLAEAHDLVRAAAEDL